MKIAVRWVGVLGVAACLSTGAAMAADKADWLVLRRVGADRPETVTVARDLPARTARAAFPVLVEVIWRYKALADGMPAADELALGKRLDDALDGVFGAKGVHVMTRTGNGARTTYYYVDNPERHADAMKKSLDALPPAKLQVRARDEPEWETVREVREAIK